MRFSWLWSLAVLACAAPYCGAPCDHRDAPPPRPDNPYGSRFGYLEPQALSAKQLRLEKRDVEVLIARNPGDQALLTTINGRADSANDFEFNGFEKDSSIFTPNGKIRRYAPSADTTRILARCIHASSQKHLFDRYRQIRLQMILSRYGPDTTVEVSKSSAADSLVIEPAGETWIPLAENPAPERAPGKADPAIICIAPPVPVKIDTSSLSPTSPTMPERGSPPTPVIAIVGRAEGTDSLAAREDSDWMGAFRVDAGKWVVRRKRFASANQCVEWGERKAENFRRDAFAFLVECRRGGELIRRKIW